MFIFDMIGHLIGGLIVGVLARLLLPGKEAFPDGPLGWLLTALLGIAGAFIGFTIATNIWRAGDASYTAASWTMAIIGAILLLLIVRLIFGRKT